MHQSGGFFLFLALLTLPLRGSVLVLPFANLSQTPSLNWVGESLAEAALETLLSEGQLVVSRQERDEGLREANVRRYAQLTRASVIELGLSMDAHVVVYGEYEVIRSPGTPQGRVRVRSSAIYLKTMQRGPEHEETAPLEALGRVQWTVAWQALKAVAGAAAPEEKRFVESRPAIRVDALESYIRGLMATAPDQRQRLLSQAVVLEPAFSQPCFQLGLLYAGRKENRVAGNWFQKVAPHDVHYREAQFRLALARHQTGDFKSAREALERIVKAVPLAEVWNNLGAAQLRLGDATAVNSFLKALDADPGEPAYHFNAGLALWRAGEYAPAAERLRAALERNPADQVATLLLGRCIRNTPARRGSAEAFERLKTEYNEAAWTHLKAMVAPKGGQP